VQIDLLAKTPKGSHGKYQKDLAADQNQLVRTLRTTALPARLGFIGQGTPARKRIADRGPPLRPGRPRPSSYDRIGPG